MFFFLHFMCLLVHKNRTIITKIFKLENYTIVRKGFYAAVNSYWQPQACISERAQFSRSGCMVVFKGCRMGSSDTVSLWYVSLSINTRFRFFLLE